MRRRRPRKMTPTPNSRGYPTVTVRDDDGSVRYRRVHRMVLRTFVGEPPPGHIARHLNGNKLDNRLSNLDWGTPQDNSDDKWTHGTMPLGERCGSSRFTRAEVLEIDRRLREGETAYRIAKDHGCYQSTIDYIRRGQTWGWLTGRAR